MSGGIHRIKIIPGSDSETRFMTILDNANVKRELLLCKLGEIFGTNYNEYFISDGLFTQIREQLGYIYERSD